MRKNSLQNVKKDIGIMIYYKWATCKLACKWCQFISLAHIIWMLSQRFISQYQSLNNFPISYIFILGGRYMYIFIVGKFFWHTYDVRQEQIWAEFVLGIHHMYAKKCLRLRSNNSLAPFPLSSYPSHHHDYHDHYSMTTTTITTTIITTTTTTTMIMTCITTMTPTKIYPN